MLIPTNRPKESIIHRSNAITCPPNLEKVFALQDEIESLKQRLHVTFFFTAKLKAKLAELLEIQQKLIDEYFANTSVVKTKWAILKCTDLKSNESWYALELDGHFTINYAAYVRDSDTPE